MNEFFSAHLPNSLMEHIKQVSLENGMFPRNDFNLPEAMGVGHYAGLFGGGVDDYAQWPLQPMVPQRYKTATSQLP